ncbi:MAG: hemolysin III family protein [Planctomycetaceae bacterium]
MSHASGLTQSEEIVNQITHGAGLALSVAGAVRLLNQSPPDAYLQAGCWIYAICLVALYAASTLSHSYRSEPHRTHYRTLDQIAIFTVMAATYTPVSLAACRDGWWNLPLILMWLLAGLGIYLKLRVTRAEMVPVWYYLLLGGIPMLAVWRLWQFSGVNFAWLTAGGVCYVLGVVFLINDRRVPYFHGIWHLLVILGSVCHYVVIYNVVIYNAAAIA